MPNIPGENSIDSAYADRQIAVAAVDITACDGARDDAVEQASLSNLHAKGERG